ncbi:MAG: hypothetical protein WA821_18530 [Anaerolineales bacterium]
MKTPPLSDAQRARPYIGQGLRRVLCTPLETLTDDYLRKHHWTVEAIFPPVPGLAPDERVKGHSLIVVVRRANRPLE